MRKVFAVLCVVIAGLFLVSDLALSQSEKNQGLPWDGLIELSGGSVSVGIGYSWGSGKLTQANKVYPLKVEGLTLGTVGVTKASAYGKVYKLNKLTDINGTYTAVGTGATLIAGGTAVAMTNSNGVVIDLYTSTEGANFSFGTAGVKIELAE